MNIQEPARDIPVTHEVDLCVLGGSTTGVFAAVAAARLGLRVAIVEQMGFFGGVATAGLVNIWHSLLSTDGKLTTIAGLTQETIDRLAKRGAMDFKDPVVWYGSFHLNTEVLKIVLDEMVTEAGIRPFLHARFCAPHIEDGKPGAAVIEDKNGRRAIKARYFIDATGDGDFVHRCGFPVRKAAKLQPPTACAVLRGLAGIAPEFPEYYGLTTWVDDTLGRMLGLGKKHGVAPPRRVGSDAGRNVPARLVSGRNFFIRRAEELQAERPRFLLRASIVPLAALAPE